MFGRPARAVAAIVLLGLTAGALPAKAAEAPADSIRAAVAAEARAAGVNPTALFAQPIEFVLPGDGGLERTPMSVGDILDRFDAMTASSAPGVLGTPEVNAGDMVHVYLKTGTDRSLGYQINNSAVVPATPAVLLPPPATPLFFDIGGPTRNVKGSYNQGLHTAGTTFGSSVDTAGGANSGDPVWLPLRSGGVVGDSSIDFVGHAQVAQSQACLFGFCVSTGAMLATGATIFDSTLPVGFPVLP